MKNTVPFIITAFVLITLYACGKYIPRDDIATAEVSEQSAEQTTTESTDMTETAETTTLVGTEENHGIDNGISTEKADELVAKLSEGIYFTCTSSYISSSEWSRDLIGYVSDESVPSSDKLGVVCIPDAYWTIEGKMINGSGGESIRKNNIDLVQILFIPKGSFCISDDTSDGRYVMLNETILRVESHGDPLYYILVDSDDDEYDCVLYFSVQNAQTEGFADYDRLFTSFTFEQIPVRVYRDDSLHIFQYDHETLWMIPFSGEPWVLSGYGSDTDIQVRKSEGGLIILNLYDRPNHYEIAVDPVTRSVYDEHMSDQALAEHLGQSPDYIDQISFQYYGGDSASAYYLYSDKIVYASLLRGKPYKKTEFLLHTDKPEGDEFDEFNEQIIQAIIYPDPNTWSYSDYFALDGGKYYHIAEKAPFSRYDSYRYYLSCLFTDESVDFLLSWTTDDSTKYLTIIDDHLYFYGTMERSDIVPDKNEVVLAEVDGGWKCDLIGSLK